MKPETELNGEEEQRYRTAPVSRGAVLGTASVVGEAVGGVLPGAADGAKSGYKSGALMMAIVAVAVTALVVGTGGLGLAAVSAYWAAGAGAAVVGTGTFASIFAASIPGVLAWTAGLSAIAGIVSGVGGAIGGAGTGAVAGGIGRGVAGLFGGTGRVVEQNHAAKQLDADRKAAEQQGYVDAKLALFKEKMERGEFPSAPAAAAGIPAHTHHVEVSLPPHPPVTHQMVHHDAHGQTVSTVAIGGAPAAHPVAGQMAAPVASAPAVAAPVQHITHNEVTHNTPAAPVIAAPHTAHTAPVTINVPVTNELHHSAPVKTDLHLDPVVNAETKLKADTHIDPLVNAETKQKSETHIDPVQKILSSKPQGNTVSNILQQGEQGSPVNRILAQNQQQPVISPQAIAAQKEAAQNQSWAKGAGAGG